MDSERKKHAFEWLYGTIFRDEAITPKPTAPAEKLPPLLRTARSLENTGANSWQSRESVFLKQAKLLANYEDDYEFHGSVVRYYPTYQSLTDQQLRGYFSWRSKLRKGDLQKTSRSFAFLYIYELLNQIGVTEPMEGYRKLEAFRDGYGALDDSIVSYLNRWLEDYVIFYELDANLLAHTKQVLFDRSITVLDMIQEQEEAKIMDAVKRLAPRWLSRSKFYSTNRSDCDRVMVRVLRRISDHYCKRTKKTMVEQFFGPCRTYQITLFHDAVFCIPTKKTRLEYALDERCVYRYQNGFWTVTKHAFPSGTCKKLEEILKTVDAVMREEYACKNLIKYETDTKWMIKIIREEAQALLAEKKAAEEKKITIDYSQLSRIRREAAITQEKLTVEEDEEETLPPFIPEPPQEVLPAQDSLLTGPEYRLLHSLLYGGSLGWIRSEGHILSVLVDSINEKLYDTFMDSVLDDTPELIEDYIEDLKEMVTP